METTQAYEMGKIIGMMLSCVLFLLIPAAFIFTLIMALTRKTKGWIIAAVASGLIGLLLIGGVLLSGVYLGIKATEANREAVVFASSDGLYEVTGAPGWRVLELESSDATLEIGNLVGEEYLIVISDLKAELGADFTLREFAETASEQTAASLTEGDSGELIETTVGGRPAYQRELRGIIEGNDISYFLSYVEGKAHFYQIMAWTLTDRKATVFPRLEAAAATFSEREVP